MRRNSALVIVAAAVCFALCVSAPTSALDCCPSCTGNQGQCYVSDEIYGSYTKGGDCLDACPGRSVCVLCPLLRRGSTAAVAHVPCALLLAV